VAVRILVVDDEPQIVRALRIILRDAGFEVLPAGTVKEALDEVVSFYPTKPVIAYGASSTLARQIENGAPADIFISADLDWMDYVDKKNLLAPSEASEKYTHAKLEVYDFPGKYDDEEQGKKLARFRLEAEQAVDHRRIIEGDASSLYPGGLVNVEKHPSSAENKEYLIVRADLPGLSKDDVKIHITDDQLIIEGERRQEREENEGGFYRSERSYGSFYRSIPLPEGVSDEDVKASFRDGVLEITMPVSKREQRHRQIEIGGEAYGEQSSARSQKASK